MAPSPVVWLSLARMNGAFYGCSHPRCTRPAQVWTVSYQGEESYIEACADHAWLLAESVIDALAAPLAADVVS